MVCQHPFFSFFKKIYLFLCEPFLKSLLNLLQYHFCCWMFCFFGREAWGILASRPGIEPTPHALESEVLTTGPPRKSLTISLLLFLPFPVFDKWTSQVVLVVKNPLANAGDLRGAGLSPGSGRSPGGGHGNTLQDSCLENPMDRGAWQATVYEVAKSWTRLSMHTHTHTYTCRHLSPFLISCH